MAAFILRRVLLMIPTMFGISLVVWLVMMFSPGRPGDKGGGMGTGEADVQKDPLKEMGADESQRSFRRGYGLDRPKAWNDWWSLDAAEIREEIRVAEADIEDVGAEAKREARERLEDYGTYAVPPLIQLLQSTQGREQTFVLYWLRRSSLRLPVKQPGREIDKAELARRSEMAVENAKLSSPEWAWPPGATKEERAEVVAKWVAWYQEKKPARWQWDFWDKVRITLTDTGFGTYWGKLLQGDLGTSHIHKRPVVDLVLERMKYTLSLNVVALVIAYLLAVPLGIFSAVKQGTWTDKAIGVVLFMLYSLPNFFVGTLLLQWLATGEGGGKQWFPISGFESDNAFDLNTWVHLKDILWHITLPLVCLSYTGLAVLSRYSRTGMLDVIRSDYVRTARAKGLSEWTVILKHVVRNGILPIVTILGTSLPVLISGSVAIEYVFGINGMGLLIINSIFQKDFYVVMGIQLIVATLTMVGILLSDVAYAMLDPRISLS